jgi:hypothetical protein
VENTTTFHDKFCQTCGIVIPIIIYPNGKRITPGVHNKKKYCSSAHVLRTGRHLLRLERVWDRVDIHPNACWLWTGPADKDGYGDFRFNYKNFKAHRAVFILTRGLKDLSRDQWVLHRCDNPPCCNPSHLFLGNCLINNQDKIAKGRANMRRGSAHKCAKLSEDDVRYILRESGGRRAKPYRGFYARMSERFNVGHVTILCVVKGDTWKHVHLDV